MVDAPTWFALPGQRVADFNIQTGLYLYVWESLGDPCRCLSGRTEFPGGCLTVFHLNSLLTARLNEGEKKCRRKESQHMIVSERVRRAPIFAGAPEPSCSALCDMVKLYRRGRKRQDF